MDNGVADIIPKGALMKVFKVLAPTLLSLALIGCSENKYANAAVVGGVTGAAVGAGTGAAIGSAISHGDVGASALLGAGVGLPVGILSAVAIQSMMEKSEIEKNNDIIQANYQYIMTRQREIDELRERLTEDSLRLTPDKSLRSDIYTGPTIGVYNY